MKPKSVFFFLLLLLGVILTGCISNRPALKTPTVAEMSHIPSSKPVATIHHQPLPSRAVSSPTSTPVPPTPTATSALSDEEVRQVFFEILENNGDCRLPCVWGLVPGETSSDEIHDILSKLDGWRGVYFIKSNIRVGTKLLYSRQNGKINIIELSSDTYTQEGVPVFGDPYHNKIFEYYLLPQVLSNYGQPSSVLLGVWREDFLKAPYDPFSVVVVYSDLGFLIEYVAPSKLVGDYLQGCITEEVYLTLWSWDTDKDLSFAEVVSVKSIDEGFTTGSAEYFRPLEEATSMTLDEFHQIFKDPNNTQCLEFPVELSWP